MDQPRADPAGAPAPPIVADPRAAEIADAPPADPIDTGSPEDAEPGDRAWGLLLRGIVALLVVCVALVLAASWARGAPAAAIERPMVSSSLAFTFAFVPLVSGRGGLGGAASAHRRLRDVLGRSRLDGAVGWSSGGGACRREAGARRSAPRNGRRCRHGDTLPSRWRRDDARRRVGPKAERHLPIVAVPAIVAAVGRSRRRGSVGATGA